MTEKKLTKIEKLLSDAEILMHDSNESMAEEILPTYFTKGVEQGINALYKQNEAIIEYLKELTSTKKN